MGNKNIDLGGGKFDLGSDYLKSQGVQNDVYDPFNRSAEHNKTVLAAAKTVPPDTVTVNNVLNVIQEPSVRANVIQQAKDLIKPGGSVFFQIYEGTGKGVGKKTTKGFQNNKKTNEYLEEIQKAFPDAERRGNVIIGTSSEPSVDEFSGGYAKGGGVSSLNGIARNMTRGYANGGGVGSMNETARSMFM